MNKEMNKRIVITGLGMVTPLGTGKDVFAKNFFQGRSGISFIEGFDTSHLPSHLGGEVKDFRPQDFIFSKNFRRMDRLSQYVTASARMAMEDAQFSVTPENRDRVGIIMGTTFGPTELKIQSMRTLFTRGPAKIHPSLVPNSVLNAPAGHASIEMGFRGINTTVNHQATSGEIALIYAVMELRRGTADVVLAGGAEILSDFFFESLVHFKALSPVDGLTEKARPFDIKRNGPVIGEGCGIVCLERLDHALARGVTPYCEISGWGISSSPSPPTGWPSTGEGITKAIQKSLHMADTATKHIDVVLAAGNGGSDPDGIEAEAYQNLFPDHTAQPSFFSYKGALGESFSSGGIGASIMALVIRNNKIPPTLGLTEPMAPLPFVMDTAKDMTIRHGLLNAVSYGGTNAAIVVNHVETD
jgi:3-oxoacyl-[acyl-carrier-protein] synthase II